MTTLINFFSSGFLYVFGLNDNPLIKLQQKYKNRSDVEAMRGDWENVGMYLKNAYESEKQQSSKKPTTSC